VVGLGCNNFGMQIDYEQSAAVVDAAFDEGITLFDTADIYGGTKSEEFLGRALSARRSEVIIGTKFGMAVDADRQGAKPEYVRRAVEDSLRRLRTDYIDLYQRHQPDPDVPLADTLGALDELVKSGKVREIGCSTFSAVQLSEAAVTPRAGAARFVSVQNEYSLLHREPEREVLPACSRFGLAFIPYFPLASGVLTGKLAPGSRPPAGSRLSLPWTARFMTEHNLAIVTALQTFVEARGRTLLDLAMSWLAARSQVSSVIAGATSPTQVRANAVAADWTLAPDDLAEIDRITLGNGTR
jgi:aryl-alcohol dehydrogenase-like predicted oxidoreductase